MYTLMMLVYTVDAYMYNIHVFMCMFILPTPTLKNCSLITTRVENLPHRIKPKENKVIKDINPAFSSPLHLPPFKIRKISAPKFPHYNFYIKTPE